MRLTLACIFAFVAMLNSCAAMSDADDARRACERAHGAKA